MSWQATNWAREQKAGSAAAKLVLILLADRADEDHSCYPGQATLAAEAECHVNSIASHLRTLEGRGLIKRVKRFTDKGHRTSDRYILPVQGELFEVSDPSETPPTEVPPTDLVGGEPTTKTGVDQPQPIVEEPSEEPSDTTNKLVSLGTDRATPVAAEDGGSGHVDSLRSSRVPVQTGCTRHAGRMDPTCRGCRKATEHAEAPAVRENLAAAAAAAHEQQEKHRAEAAVRRRNAAPAEVIASAAAKIRADIRAAKHQNTTEGEDVA